MPNENELLWPGTLVQTYLNLRRKRRCGARRRRAGQPDRQLTCSSSRTASPLQPVKVARTLGNVGDLESGVSAASVVTDGHLQLTNGARVAIRAAGAMTLSELCIRRPVMTTLITASIIVFGVFGYRLLPVSALPRSTSRPSRHRDAAGRQPGNHGGLGRRHRSSGSSRPSPASASMTSTSSLGTHHDHHPVRSQPQHRRRGARRADRADHRAAPAADRDDDAAELPQGESGDFPVLFISAELGDAAAVDGRRIRRHTIWRSRFRSFPASRRCWSTARRNSPCASRPIRSRPRRATSRSRTSAPRCRQGQLQHAGRHAERAEAGRHAAGLRRDGQGGDYSKVVVAYRNGAPVKLDEIARVIDSVENDKIASWFNGERAVVLAIQRSRTPTPSRWSIRCGALPQYRAQVPPRSMEVMMDRSISIRESVARRAGDAADRHRCSSSW
jgi:HAE1 family hydrophobic/amphiphilic exporter-1